MYKTGLASKFRNLTIWECNICVFVTSFKILLVKYLVLENVEILDFILFFISMMGFENVIFQFKCEKLFYITIFMFIDFLFQLF